MQTKHLCVLIHISSIGVTLGPMRSRSQIQDGGTIGVMVARSKKAAGDAFGYTSEGKFPRPREGSVTS